MDGTQIGVTQTPQRLYLIIASGKLIFKSESQNSHFLFLNDIEWQLQFSLFFFFFNSDIDQYKHSALKLKP